MIDPAPIVREFVARINRQDLPGLLDLMTPDHRLIDSGGAVVAGREALRSAWGSYFQMVPDYQVVVDDTLARGEVVVVVGRAEGTYAPDGRLTPDRRWAIPAAWRAVVRRGRVAEWQVYADNEPMRRLMARDAKGV